MATRSAPPSPRRGTSPPAAPRRRARRASADHVVTLAPPAWVAMLPGRVRYRSDADKMRLAIAAASGNVEHGTGGPFGAAVFARAGGRLVAIGVNRVVPLGNSTAHAEMLAIQIAQARLGTHTLPGHELFTSCEPCAMCLGATLWSGVDRLVCAATSDDARAIGFDEGPVFPKSFAYLTARGVAIVRGLLRDEARAVLSAYARSGAPIY